MNTSNTLAKSASTFIKGSIAAVIIAVLVSVFVMLPAQYNIIPTSITSALTLTSIAQASEVAAVEEVVPAEQSVPERSDTVTVEIPSHKGLEYKLLMEKYSHLEYEWSTDGEELYFDFHGEPKGDTTGYFESFAITTSSDMKGSLTAPFAGSHGWYWKNETDAPVIVTLSIKGNYVLKQ
jgi:hypothetical protein